jgi:hypothetical protein
MQQEPSMESPETVLKTAQRHVAEAQVRVMRQRALVAALWQQGRDAAQAEQLLATFELVLDSMREHVAIEAEHVHARSGLE